MKYILIFSALFLFGCSELQPEDKTYYEVKRVVDGDTIKIELDGELTSLRLIGLDTPETYTIRTGYKECYGDMATEFARGFFDGQKVRIEYDDTQSRQDMYGRHLVHVFLEDGRLFQEESIRLGYGFWYVYKNKSKYWERFSIAEQAAKDLNRGVWSACDGERRRE